MKLLITSVSTGHGHVRAAEALEAACHDIYPFIEVKHIDAMHYMEKSFQQLYVNGYSTIVNKAPSVWGYLYELTNRETGSLRHQQLMNTVQSNFTPRLAEFIADYKPDRILSTHFLIPQILNTETNRQRLPFPIDLVVTDYEFHRFWYSSNVSRYYVGSQQIYLALIQRGIHPRNIDVTGIPIHPDFSKTVVKDDPLITLKLDPNRKTILILFGGAGVGPAIRIVEKLFQINTSLNIITVSGRNQTMKNQLDRLRVPEHMALRNCGFVSNMNELIGSSDLVISKSGGLTTAECMALGTPMLIFSPIPGQEEKNASYIETNGAGLRAHTLADLVEKLVRLLSHPQQLHELREHAIHLGQPRAAAHIINRLVVSSKVEC